MRNFILSLICFFSLPSWAQSVVFETNLGSFTVELNQEKAPITVENFLRYVKDGSYEGTQFHRVIANFMAQGGGFNEDMVRLPSYDSIKNEASNGLKNDTATIAMARTANPHSATRQFFINLQNNDFLNHSKSNPGYAVFGKVTKGFEVIKEMATKPTKSKGRMKDIPITPIVIKKVFIQK